MTLEAIREIVRENKRLDRDTFQGLSTDEIARYNRALMFGADDEAFPDAADWSTIVD